MAVFWGRVNVLSHNRGKIDTGKASLQLVAWVIVMDDDRTPNPAAELANRVLAALCGRGENIPTADIEALLSYAQSDSERRLPLRSLAVLIIDRERQGSTPDDRE